MDFFNNVGLLVTGELDKRKVILLLPDKKKYECFTLIHYVDNYLLNILLFSLYIWFVKTWVS